MNIPLSLACWNYDRTRALLEGRVAVEGVDLTYLNLPVEETFFRMMRFHEFDASEMSLSSYGIVSILRETALHRDSGVSFCARSGTLLHLYQRGQRHSRAKKDLLGKRVASPGIPIDCTRSGYAEFWS